MAQVQRIRPQMLSLSTQPLGSTPNSFSAPFKTLAVSVFLTHMLAALAGWTFWHMASKFLPWVAIYAGVFALGRLQRKWAFTLFATFYLAGTYPLVQAANAIAGADGIASVLLWLAHGLIAAIPVLLLRGAYPGWRAAAVALLYIVPPFGYWTANPPTLVIGLFFPGSGLFGLVGLVLLAFVIAEFDHRRRAHQFFGIALACMVAGCNLAYVGGQKELPSNWHALNTNFGNNGADLERRMTISNTELPTLLKHASDGKPSFWFLAEGMIYDWSETTDVLWASILSGANITAVAGGYQVDEESRAVSSMVYVLGDSKVNPEVRKQLANASASTTFPFSMWNPFKKSGHFPMHWPNGTVPIDGRKVHLSWCYESNIIWPHIAVAMEKPDVMVSIENRWTSAGTSLEFAQDVAGALNARWLGAPLLRALNH